MPVPKFAHYRMWGPEGLWQDDARTVAVTGAGQAVAVIDDRSGNGYHLTQSTAGDRMIYSAIDNGTMALVPDGANDGYYRQLTLPDTWTKTSGFIMVGVVGFDWLANFQRVITLAESGTPTNRIFLGTGDVANRRFYFDNAVQYDIINTAITSGTKSCLFSLTYASDTRSARINRTTYAPISPAAFNTWNFNRLGLGRDENGSSSSTNNNAMFQELMILPDSTAARNWVLNVYEPWLMSVLRI